jgi:hypothetical protein
MYFNVVRHLFTSYEVRIALTDLVHVQAFPLELGTPYSSLESQESACQHHPFPLAEYKQNQINNHKHLHISSINKQISTTKWSTCLCRPKRRCIPFYLDLRDLVKRPLEKVWSIVVLSYAKVAFLPMSFAK